MLNVLFIAQLMVAYFGKISRIASEGVVIQLLKSKCIPILLCALEVNK